MSPLPRHWTTIDANEACASIAYRTNEVIAIYPITPASPMGELADAWANERRPSVFGTVPEVIEMQSEGGAAGAVHGALQTGALTTTFTASQGLLLMIPNMFKIAGELTPTVFHIAARTIATHALSIFGDHSDVMSARSTGWAMLASNTVQEAHDLALIAHAATLRSRVPILHFFDGFRTSHELNKVEVLTDEDILSMLDQKLVAAHRSRGLDPDRPVLRGTAQNPDVFFQAREASNAFYAETPGIVQRAMDQFAQLAGRRYRLFEYVGHAEADRVIVIMGSGAGAVEETIEALAARGERVGMVKVRLYRPFDCAAFVQVFPPTVRRIAVLDRCKEPGAVGEPLYLDVIAALAEEWPTQHDRTSPVVIGGRYGLSSKEFTPSMVVAVFTELSAPAPKRHFTIGIVDDLTHTSLAWDRTRCVEPADVRRAVFFGLGSDGTVGATKNSVKIIGEGTDLHVQGYFVYDSKKAGAVTVSHLRFSPRPINSSYLIQTADFVACHQFHLLERMDVLETAQDGGIFLLNSPYPHDQTWRRLPREVQEQIITRRLRLFVINAQQIADEAGLGGRINTVMQTCFFALSNVLPREEALDRIRKATIESYGKRGESVVRRNLEAIDRAIDGLHEITAPAAPDAARHRLPPVPAHAPDFVQRVTAMMIAGRGDLLPVSALPVDGTFPTGTAKWEKRSIAREIPIWDPPLCIDCGLCALVCPHAAIRMKVFDPAELNGDGGALPSKSTVIREFAGRRLSVQVAPDDCTGCGICVETCPAYSKESVKHKAINMQPKLDHLEREQANFEAFMKTPETRRRDVRLDTVVGSQLVDPLFEYSGACQGCGETPYLKLLTQLFGDRVIVANATGCSSIFGGNLPTTPWSCDAAGRGPAWSNSLFEDNAEFGLGMRLALDQKLATAKQLLMRLSNRLDPALVKSLVEDGATDEMTIALRREQVQSIRTALASDASPDAVAFCAVADVLVPRSVWIIGGDGWAYDIGFGGLDHVLASSRKVNILVLDTEVYSNTGGQASKSTPRGAVAKFASGGKPGGKKDLALLAMAYGNVYVANIAMGANPKQTLRAFHEAESYPGTSLIIAYSHCIAHGIDMTTAMQHQKGAVDSGYWPLFRFDPRQAQASHHPLHMDSAKPKIPLRDFALKEARFALLAQTQPERAQRLLALAQKDIDARWRYYEQMAGVERDVPELEVAP